MSHRLFSGFPLINFLLPSNSNVDLFWKFKFHIHINYVAPSSWISFNEIILVIEINY